jgi:hypothetical protein
MKNLLSLTTCLAFLFLANGCDESILSPARSEISNFEVNYDFGIINGKPDAGYTVTFNVKNKGEYGSITIIPKLTCSEGEWLREQTLILDKGESRVLSYFFHEPTINSTNVQATVHSNP